MCDFDFPFSTFASQYCKNKGIMDAKHRHCLDLSLGSGCKDTIYEHKGNCLVSFIGPGAREPHDKSWHLNFLLPLLPNKCKSSTTLTSIIG